MPYALRHQASYIALNISQQRYQNPVDLAHQETVLLPPSVGLLKGKQLTYLWSYVGHAHMIIHKFATGYVRVQCRSLLCARAHGTRKMRNVP